MKYAWSNILNAVAHILGVPTLHLQNGFAPHLKAPWEQALAATPGFNLSRYQAQYEQSLQSRFGELCNESNIAVRKNWEHLNASERKSYIDAVKCLRSRPPVTPKSVAPGVFNRMDDYNYQHITQTTQIHFSGWLLPWHRYFLHQYEKGLRDECGYVGYQPYWDWTMHSSNLSASAVFDGSETSFGSNGEYRPHGTIGGILPGVPEPQYYYRPPGTGGGCVTDGPWDNNFTVTLGPIFLNNTIIKSESEWFSSHPRCLTRDFLQPLASLKLSIARVETLLEKPSLGAFREVLDDHIHLGGHASVGGDLTDVFTSINDPVFFLHHAQIDRLWALWQNQGPDPLERIYTTSHTITYNNSPPSRNATLGDTLAFGPVGGDVFMYEVVDTVRGPLCYRYE